MIAKVLPLLNRLIPSSLARKGLVKNIPQLDGFFESALAAGYGIDTALDFLRNQHEGNNQLRPDEQAAETRVRQQGATGEAIQKLGNLAGIGAGAAAIPAVIGNLFQGERETPPSIPPPDIPKELQHDKKRIEALQNARKRQKKSSELSREELLKQFEEYQQQQQSQQGKAALLQTMQEITESIRRMRGQGG